MKTVSIPETEYKLLRSIYEYHRKAGHHARILEVEQNIASKNYTTQSLGSFIDEIQ